METRDDVTTVPAFAEGEEQSAVAVDVRGVELGDAMKSVASLLRFAGKSGKKN